MWQGWLRHIHVAEEGRAPMQARDQAKLIPGKGIAGDRYSTGRGTTPNFLTSAKSR